MLQAILIGSSWSVPYQNDPYKKLKTTRNTQNNKTQQTMPERSVRFFVH